MLQPDVEPWREGPLGAAAGLICALMLLTISSAAQAHAELDPLIEKATQAIAEEPGDASRWLARAELHRLHGDYAAAKGDLDEAGRLDPKLGAVALARANLLLDTGATQDAVSALSVILRTKPDELEALRLRARAFTLLGQHEAAAKDLRAVLTASPAPSPDDYVRLVRTLEAGEIPVAARLAVLDEGLRDLGPNIALLVQALDLEEGAGLWDAALARLDTILKGLPRPELMLARRAHILEKADRPIEARAGWAQTRDAIARLPVRLQSQPKVQAALAEATAALAGEP